MILLMYFLESFNNNIIIALIKEINFNFIKLQFILLIIR